jgi:uncharacterized protein (DUF1501 family)
MKNLPHTRKEFIKLSSSGIGLLAFGQFAPEFLVRSAMASSPKPEKDKSILVLVQLAGGNDGLNTLVPYEDSNYYNLRPKIAIKKKDAIALNSTHGLHPSMSKMFDLYNSGKMGIIQNVGYPNPNRSHFRSTEIWETAMDSDRTSSTGWIGRFLDNACSGMPSDSHDPAAIHMTGNTPQSFGGKKPHSTFGFVNRINRRDNDDTRKLLESSYADKMMGDDNSTFLKQTLMNTLVTERKVQQKLDAYKPSYKYPNSNLASSLRNVAALIHAGLPTRVYFVSIGGFDTHSNQLLNHGNLLSQLSEALFAFQKDLEGHKLDNQVTTMTFSEFGRRPNENDSAGTDHGTAAPLFVLGSNIKGGVYGKAPNLKLQKNQDVEFSTDFRQVYSTLLEKWMNCPPEPVLFKKYSSLDIIS